MSDALTDINRDNKMNQLTFDITILWLNDEDYSKQLEELRGMSRGYFNSRGEAYAKHIEKLFGSCEGDKFEHIAPHFANEKWVGKLDEFRKYVKESREIHKKKQFLRR